MKHAILNKIAASIFLVSSTSAALAGSVSLSTATPIVQAGSQIVFDINIDFRDIPLLGGGLDVNYTGFTDTNQLTFLSYTPSTTIGLDPGFGRAPVAQPTRLNGIGFTADFNAPGFAGLTGPVSIGQIIFQANVAGDYSLGLSINTAEVGGFIDVNNQQLPRVLMQGSNFKVAGAAAVPLPGTLALFIGGLAGLLAYAKNSRKAGM